MNTDLQRAAVEAAQALASVTPADLKAAGEVANDGAAPVDPIEYRLAMLEKRNAELDAAITSVLTLARALRVRLEAIEDAKAHLLAQAEQVKTAARELVTANERKAEHERERADRRAAARANAAGSNGAG